MQISLQDFVANVNRLVNTVNSEAVSKVMQTPVEEALSNIKHRITDEGQNTSGGQIGQYSIKPLYAGQKQFAKPSAFRGVGKNGGTPRKTMYMSRGYKELRDVQALRTDFMNLEYRGDLITDYKMQQVAQAFVIGFTTELQSLKRQGQEDKRGTIFSPSTEEIAGYYSGIDKNMQRLTFGTLNGESVSL